MRAVIILNGASLLVDVRDIGGSARPQDITPEIRVMHMTIEAMTPERKTISINKATELVGVSRRTIYNWIASGKVEYVRTAGGSVRIFVDTLWRTPEHTTVSRHDGRRVAAAG